jgi:hypothetical protein
MQRCLYRAERTPQRHSQIALRIIWVTDHVIDAVNVQVHGHGVAAVLGEEEALLEDDLSGRGPDRQPLGADPRNRFLVSRRSLSASL